MSDFWEFAARMKKETDNWPQWKRAAGGLPPVNHDLLAERAPQPPADLVQATQDGEHPAIHAKSVRGMKAVRMSEGEEAAAKEILRLRDRNAKLERALEEREADIHSRIRAGYDKTVADSWRAANEKLQHENAALRERVKVLERVREAANTLREVCSVFGGNEHAVGAAVHELDKSLDAAKEQP